MRDTSKYHGYPSVTEVLDLAGMVDLSMIPTRYLEAARVRGTKVHHRIDRLSNDPASAAWETPDPVVVPYIEAWERWKVESGFVMEKAEQVVVSDRWKFAGTFDVLGIIDDRWALVDHKARYALTPEVGPQLAGYEIALDLGEPVDRYALLLKPNGKYDQVRCKDRTDRNTFLAANIVAHWKLSNKLASLDEIRKAAA
jgi:hypothetical protein